MNRVPVPAAFFLATCAGLLMVSGCSTTIEEQAAPTTTSTVTATTTSTAVTTTATSTSEPSDAKASFCREVNTAINIAESPGSTLTETQGNDMVRALQSASDNAPSDVPADMTNAITALIADLQAPTENLPPSFNTNGDKLAQAAAYYCG